MACPNINLDSWKNLVAARGEDIAYYLWDKYDGDVPEAESKASIVKAGLKSVNALQSNKAIQVFSTLEKNRIKGDAFWNKLQADLQIPKDQIELLKQYNTTNREELITNMLADYSYAVEINLSREGGNVGKSQGKAINEARAAGLKYGTKEFEDFVKNYLESRGEVYVEKPTQYYSNLTVPGGTNYTENEITTPAITPSIKGHAQFATDKGIGWFRSDDKMSEQDTRTLDKKVSELSDVGVSERDIEGGFRLEKGEGSKTRRILEVQSDLFQKGRNNNLLIGDELDRLMSTNFPKEEKSKNQFLQLLNKANNWVTFFVKSIIQDSAKKGYEKVLFPSGDTASKVEGHTTLEEFKRQKEDRIKVLEAGLNLKPDPNIDFTKYSFRELKDMGYDYLGNEDGKAIWKPLVKDKTEALNEINQLKQELERVEKEGFAALRPIFKFYEEDVTNILKKQGYSPKQVTDEYGNTWNEVKIVPQREAARILLQTGEMPVSRAAEETLKKMKEAAKKMGIDIQDLTDYAKANPDVDTKSATGVADLAKGVIAIAEGRADTALTEELVHIATAMVDQVDPKLITALISKIDRFKIYKQTLEAYKGRKGYQLSDGKPNIRKIKKEAADKLISEVIINKNEGTTEFPELLQEENRSFLRRMWDAILDVIRGIYTKSNIDLFEKAAGIIETGEIGLTASELRGEGVFLQVVENKAVNNIYNTIRDYAKRMQLVDTTADKKRHYTFDGKEVARSVTEKVKEIVAKKFERTDFEKMQDKQKREWGDRGHKYIAGYISNVLIDKDGYKKAVPTEVEIESELDETIKEKLRNFAKELVNSYPIGTRFIIEEKMINTKVKGMLASTIDFIAIEPVGDNDFKMHILDWKFMNIDKSREEDVPWYKQSEWKPQMGEYALMAYNYGVRRDQLVTAQMVPFAANYQNTIRGDFKSPLVLTSIEIGDLKNPKETALYLLPVPINSQSSGNKEVDRLVESFRQQYEKLYKTLVSPEERYAKTLQLNELGKAIRSLQLKFDFSGLVNVGIGFLNNAASTINSLKKADFSKMSQEEVKKKLQDLLEYRKSAEKFSGIGDVFTSQYAKESLSPEGKKVLSDLDKVSSSIGRMLEDIEDIQREYVIQLAIKEKDIPTGEAGEVTEESKEAYLAAEKEVKGLISSFTEPTKLGSRLIRLAARLYLKSKSLISIKISRMMNEFEKVLLPLQKEAAAAGKSAFDMIGEVRNGQLRLIRKVDPEFWNQISIEKKAGNKKFFKDNMDMEKFNELAKAAIEKGEKELNAMQFSSDPEMDKVVRSYRIKKLKDSIDINRESFNGYTGYQFGYLFNKAMLEEKHLSDQYRAMSETARKVWTFMTNLNQWAKDMGYIEKEGISFFPLMEATMLQKLAQADGKMAQIRDFFADAYTVRINELPGHAKIDPETNRLKKVIPRYFTRTDMDVNQLSKDLNKVGALWIKSLLEYENAKNLENILLTIHSVEENRGHIVTNEEGEPIFVDGVPKVDERSNKTAELLEKMIDDEIYGIREDIGSFGNIGITKISEKLSKTEEGKEKTALSIKKVLQRSNILVRSLAVGLKPLIAIANYFGFKFQAFINAGNMYRFREFEKNNFAVTTGIGMTTIDKGLIDLLVPLNDDITNEKRRHMAKKNSYLEYLATWSFSDVMMSTNTFPERKLQLANAKTFNDNSMVINGEIVNIRQYLRAQDRIRYTQMSESERRALERTFEQRVAELREKSSLSKIAKEQDGMITVPGVTDEELAKYRTTVIEYGRKLSGMMSDDNKAAYRRDSLFSSFMMFKTWIPKQLGVRFADLDKDKTINEWEYGRVRLFVKTWAHLGILKIFRMKHILLGTDEGLRIMDEMLEQKRIEHYNKTGQVLEITNEEFYDLVRRELSREMKELGVLFGTLGLIIAAKMAQPPDDDEDRLAKNRYNYFLKMVNKISDEMKFYYNPLSFESFTRGSVLPQVGLLTKAYSFINDFSGEVRGYALDDEKMMEKNHPLKYFFNMIPGAYQFETDVLPLVNPDLAKEMGIRVSTQSRLY